MSLFNFIDFKGDLASADADLVTYVCVHKDNNNDAIKNDGKPISKIRLESKNCYFTSPESVKELTDKINAALDSEPVPIFIELKSFEHDDKPPIFINPREITIIRKVISHDDYWTKVYTDFESFRVLETPEEVIGLINAALGTVEVEVKKPVMEGRTLEV